MEKMFSLIKYDSSNDFVNRFVENSYLTSRVMVSLLNI